MDQQMDEKRVPWTDEWTVESAVQLTVSPMAAAMDVQWVRKKAALKGRPVADELDEAVVPQ